MARRACLLLLLCGAGLASPETGAPAYEEGMKSAHGLLERGRFAEGKARLQKLLEEHANAPYVLGRRVQVEDLMRQPAFGAAFPPPEPKKIVSFQ